LERKIGVQVLRFPIGLAEEEKPTLKCTDYSAFKLARAIY